MVFPNSFHPFGPAQPTGTSVVPWGWWGSAGEGGGRASLASLMRRPMARRKFSMRTAVFLTSVEYTSDPGRRALPSAREWVSGANGTLNNWPLFWQILAREEKLASQRGGGVGWGGLGMDKFLVE